MRQGPEFAELIEQSLPLVKHIVFQVSVRFPRHVDREELVRAGVLGLVQAARRYDPAKGVLFQRFAAQRIRGAILDAVRSIDWAPRSVRRAARSLESATDALAHDLGRTPTSAETAAALGMTIEALAGLQERVGRSVVLGLDMSVLEDDHETFDLVPDGQVADPGEQLEVRELHAYLRDAVELLPERQRLVIEGYFFEGKTSEELAGLLGVTVSRIYQLRSDAFEMLREGITAQHETDGGGDPVPSTARVGDRAARRKAAYAAAIAARSTWKTRLEDSPAPGSPAPLRVAI